MSHITLTGHCPDAQYSNWAVKSSYITDAGRISDCEACNIEVCFDLYTQAFIESVPSTTLRNSSIHSYTCQVLHALSRARMTSDGEWSRSSISLNSTDSPMAMSAKSETDHLTVCVTWKSRFTCGDEEMENASIG